MILVAGANGQLGTRIVDELLSRGTPVRVLVRSAESARRFEAKGCESYVGDVTKPGEAKGAFPNVTTVVSTVNAAMPVKAGDTLRSVDVGGHRNLLTAALELGVCRQFVFTSVIGASAESPVPIFRAKHETERMIESSGIGYTIFRFPAFLDIWVPMMGIGKITGSLENPTVGRDFPFARSHYLKIKDSVEQRGVIHFAGSGSSKHAAIAVEDCARLMAASVGRNDCLNRIFEVTGPQAVSAEEIAQIVEMILGGRLHRKKTPAWMFSLLEFGMRGNPAAANLMAINHYTATTNTEVKGQDVAQMLNVDLKPPEQWLRERLAVSRD